jgi:hypothetical protein
MNKAFVSVLCALCTVAACTAYTTGEPELTPEPVVPDAGKPKLDAAVASYLDAGATLDAATTIDASADARPEADAPPPPVVVVGPGTLETMPQARDAFYGEENVMCPAGTLATGIAVNRGNLALDAIGLQCSVVNSDGTLGAQTTTGLVGSQTETNIEGAVSCPPGMIGVEFRGLSGDRFGVMRLSCMLASERAKRFAGSIVRTDFVGSGDTRGLPEVTSACPTGYALSGLRVGIGNACFFGCWRTVGKITPICTEIAFK